MTTEPFAPLIDVPDDVVEDLGHYGSMVADSAILSPETAVALALATPAERTAFTVRAALLGLLRNGYLAAIPEGDRPAWFAIDVGLPRLPARAPRPPFRPEDAICKPLDPMLDEETQS